MIMLGVLNNYEYTYRNFNEIKYFDYKEAYSNQRILTEIKKDYEQLDQEIRNSKMRKQKGYIIKGYVLRKIITIFGEVSIIRTKYQYYHQAEAKNKTVYLLDNYVQIERYKRMNLHLRLAIMHQLSTGKRQRDIVDQFKAAGITRASISSLARTIDTKDLNDESLYWDYKIPKEIVTKQYIYLNVDDTFTSLRQNKKKGEYRIRLAVSHLGHVDRHAKRKQLLQKRGFYLIAKIPVTRSSIPTIEYAEQVYKQLTVFYGDISDKKIIVCGDGAKWIQELANCLAADYVLDKYHLARIIYQTFPHHRKSKIKIKNMEKQVVNSLHKAIYERCNEFLNKGDANSLILYLKSLNEIEFLPSKIHKINELITYVINHKDGINNYQKPYYIGSQTEAMVSHLVKSIKGYGAKVYNIKTFVNLLNLRLGHINKLSPVDIYCDKVFETAEIKKNYFAENLWIKNKDNKWTEPVAQYEIPIMNGKKSPISSVFYHLINGTKIF